MIVHGVKTNCLSGKEKVPGIIIILLNLEFFTPALAGGVSLEAE